MARSIGERIVSSFNVIHFEKYPVIIFFKSTHNKKFEVVRPKFIARLFVKTSLTLESLTMNHFSEKRGGNKADAQVNSGDNRNHKYMTFVFFVRGLAFRSDEDIYLQSQVSHTAETFDQNCR